MVKAAELPLAWVHAGNTSGLDTGELAGWLAGLAARVGARAMVREGLGLYGYSLPLSDAGASKLRGRVEPVLTWKTRLLAVSEVRAGARVGYNGTFTARRPMRLGLLPVGYADGLRRELSSSDQRSGGWVTIRGRRASIVGRISMNLTSIDLTDSPDAAVHDEVVLLGEGITAASHAELAGTIPYEILCGIRAAEAREA
jgi:alanine racemase